MRETVASPAGAGTCVIKGDLRRDFQPQTTYDLVGLQFATTNREPARFRRLDLAPQTLLDAAEVVAALIGRNAVAETAAE